MLYCSLERLYLQKSLSRDLVVQALKAVDIRFDRLKALKLGFSDQHSPRGDCCRVYYVYQVLTSIAPGVIALGCIMYIKYGLVRKLVDGVLGFNQLLLVD